MGRHGLPRGGEAPRWDRGGHPAIADRPPRRLRAALLLVVAFFAAGTAVVAGVRLLAAGQTGAATEAGIGLPCPPGSDCAALFPPSATPSAVGTGGPATGRATPGPEATRPAAGRPETGPPTAGPPTAVPRPSVSRTPKASPSPSRPPRPSATATGGADPEATPRPSPPPTTAGPPTDAPRTAEPARPRPKPPAPKKAVVRFTVLHEANGRYTAEIAIGNEGRGDLAGWEISIPIEGRAFAVDGARAFQRGRTLVLGSADLIPSGGGVAVTIAVRGEPIPPDFCRLRGGGCRLLPPGPELSAYG